MTATRRQTRWTPEEDSRLRELAAQGWSATRIGEALSVPERMRGRSSVIGRARTLGVALQSGEGWFRSGSHRAACSAPGASEAARLRVKPGEPAPLGAPGELGEGCRWIHGEVGADWRCCGQPRAGGSVYCGHHHARVFTGRAGWTREAPSGQPNRLQGELARLRAEARS
jgi:hypothetical protein